MKKLLFILFFPITVPAYLLYKFFAWFFSEGLPDTVSFFRRRILPWFKSYAAYKSDELKEITESEAAEEEKTESEMTADVATEEETSVDEPTEIGGASKETLEYIQHMLINQNKKTTVDLPNPVKGPSPNRNNAAKEAAPASKEKSIIISRTVFDDPESFISEITVSESGSGITVTGHLPPYTPQEYRKIRHYETQNQIKRLKKIKSLIL